jgi:hypothetical protein
MREGEEEEEEERGGKEMLPTAMFKIGSCGKDLQHDSKVADEAVQEDLDILSKGQFAEWEFVYDLVQ